MIRAEGQARGHIPSPTGAIMNHITASLTIINDVTWDDARNAEVVRDLIEVRDGDEVLDEIWVESTEDEAPYAAAVARFGQVTWL